MNTEKMVDYLAGLDESLPPSTPIIKDICERLWEADLADENAGEAFAAVELLQQKLAQAEAILTDVALSVVEWHDPRACYVVVQIDAETWESLSPYRKPFESLEALDKEKANGKD